MLTAQKLIQKYLLQPHPEGGWYRETYRSSENIPHEALPGRFSGARTFSTMIYFLLEQGNFSTFHRIRADECWHFYAGDLLLIYVIEQDGSLNIIQLGNDTDKEQMFQFVVPANCWFASRPAYTSRFSFVGCTVAPGFDFADFEIGIAADLSALYPQHESILKELCR
ncbi:MAG: cupin domain-containing protein [Ginsengibacter sp.]